MKRLTQVLLLAGATAIAASAASADSRQVGVNAAIRNSVQERPFGGSLHPAVLRAPVGLGDAVVSGSQSALQMLLLDHSVFTVGANASVTIDKFVYDPDRGTSDVAASVAKGAFRFMSGHSLSGFGKNAISTPVATIGVRGTIVEGVVGPDALTVAGKQSGLPSGGDPNTASLIVLVGPGTGSQGFDKPGAIDVTIGGNTISLEHPGDALFVPGAGQAPVGPFTMSDAALGELVGLLTPPPNGTDQGDFDIQSASAASGQTLQAGPPVSDPFNASTGTIGVPQQNQNSPISGGKP
jgi:hypothetical protein